MSVGLGDRGNLFEDIAGPFIHFLITTRLSAVGDLACQSDGSFQYATVVHVENLFLGFWVASRLSLIVKDCFNR